MRRCLNNEAPASRPASGNPLCGPWIHRRAVVCRRLPRAGYNRASPIHENTMDEPPSGEPRQRERRQKTGLTRGKRSPPTSSATSPPLSVGKSASGCPSVATFTTSWVRSTPSAPNWTPGRAGGTARRPASKMGAKPSTSVAPPTPSPDAATVEPTAARLAPDGGALSWSSGCELVAPRESGLLLAQPAGRRAVSDRHRFGGTEQAAAVSRDGRFVAFLSDRDGRMDVWVTQVGTGQFYDLTRGRVRELVNPSVRTLGFSPDGSLVTFWARGAGCGRRPRTSACGRYPRSADSRGRTWKAWPNSTGRTTARASSTTRRGRATRCS